MTVQATDVERVLGATDLTTDELEAFINAAGRMYDRRTQGESVPGETRDDVVTRLAAHLIATGPERQFSSAGEGGGNVSFEGETGEGLSATTHGQLAVTLDPTGALAGADKPSPSVDVPDAKGLDG
mgnify:CR=1 FL=1